MSLFPDAPASEHFTFFRYEDMLMSRIESIEEDDENYDELYTAYTQLKEEVEKLQDELDTQEKNLNQKMNFLHHLLPHRLLEEVDHPHLILGAAALVPPPDPILQDLLIQARVVDLKTQNFRMIQTSMYISTGRGRFPPKQKFRIKRSKLKLALSCLSNS
jgi:hypothetical protein